MRSFVAGVFDFFDIVKIIGRKIATAAVLFTKPDRGAMSKAIISN